LIFYGTARITGQQGKLENDRAEAERNLTEQRAQDAALQAYLDQMSTLLLEKDLRNSGEDSGVRTLARARTATVIQRLDAEGNRNVIRFLEEAGLACSESTPGLLAGVDLRGAHLESVDLSTIDLSNAILNGAKLSKTDLREANLSNAILNGAKLRKTNLPEANLSYAHLRDAKLDGTILFSADLSGADLRDADLRGAILDYADLSDAQGITKEQLKKQTEHLHGTTMPDGSLKLPVLPPGNPYGTVHHAPQEGDC